MLDHLRATLGEELVSKVQNAKALVVGSGGIGCELLKNLVLSGFVNIHLIDLDTIDVSNLNRQFLFRSQHVGQSKSLVAKEAGLRFNPKADIVAHHGNIKSSQFGIEYFRSFDIVMNALDNVDARKHVNRICLAADVPLIESGTTGYLGQVSVIKKQETECYECTAKVTQKVYPICTIRSTPDKPVHCIVWAKELYKLLFGKMEESMLYEDPSGEEKSVYMHLVERPNLDQCDSSDPSKFTELLTEYANNVFRGVFQLEIEKKLGMKTYKGATKKPQPLKLEDVQVSSGNHSSTANVNSLQHHRVWSLFESYTNFVESIVKMHLMDVENAKSGDKLVIGSCQFDKDDKVAMNFVTAASNLRSVIFNIEPQSSYSCKGIAGNIIPAIATTNAIVAGIEVLQAFKILADPEKIKENCRYTYCNRSWTSRGVLLNPTKLSPPHKDCYVCNRRILDITLDIDSFTLGDLVKKVLKPRLGVNEAIVSVNGSIIFEEGEDAEAILEKNLTKTLANLPAGGVKDKSMIEIEDFTQDFTCSLLIHQLNTSIGIAEEDEFPEGFILGKQAEIVAEDKLSVKRKGDEENLEHQPTKKLRTNAEANMEEVGDGVVNLE